MQTGINLFPFFYGTNFTIVFILKKFSGQATGKGESPQLVA
jgi:hypothetical protein